MARRVDPWEAVWQAYDSERVAAEIARSEPRRRPFVEARGPRWNWLVAALGFLVLSCCAGASLPALSLWAAAAWRDMPASLSQQDTPRSHAA